MPMWNYGSVCSFMIKDKKGGREKEEKVCRRRPDSRRSQDSELHCMHAKAVRSIRKVPRIIVRYNRSRVKAKAKRRSQ